MGVLGLWQMLDSIGHPIKLEALEGKRLSVDASIWLHKFIRGFRDKETGGRGIDSHKLGLFNRLCKLLFYRIKPIFVFDGPAPVLKRRTLERRQNTRNKELIKTQNTAMKVLAEQLKQQYPDMKIDDLIIRLPKLRSHNLAAAGKLGDEDKDLFYLPESLPGLEEDEYEDEEKELSNQKRQSDTARGLSCDSSDDEPQIDYSHLVRQQAKVDLESSEFCQLPPETRYEILHDIKDTQKRRNRVTTLPENSESFSNLQVQRLLARRSIQEKIEKCERDICDGPHQREDQCFVFERRVRCEEKQAAKPEFPETSRSIPEEVKKCERDIFTGPHQRDDQCFVPEKRFRCEEKPAANHESPETSKKDQHQHQQNDLSELDRQHELGELHQDHELVEIDEQDDNDDEDEDEEEDLVEVDQGQELGESNKEEQEVDENGWQQDLVELVQEQEVVELDDEDQEQVELIREPELVELDEDEKEADELDQHSSEQDQHEFERLKEESKTGLSQALATSDSKVGSPKDTPTVLDSVIREVERPRQQIPIQAGPSGQPNQLSLKIIEESKELLRLFGVPYIVATGEAEAQCAVLEELKLTDGTITDDSDIWLFGAKNVYRYFFNDDKYAMQYKMTDIEFHLRMDRDNLVCFAMLVGSDYTDGIMNVGPVSAIEILSEFPGSGMEPLEKFRRWKDRFESHHQLKGRLPASKTREKLLKCQLPEGFPSRLVFEGYTKPSSDTSTDQFSWGLPEWDELRDYARRNFDWNDKKIDERILPVMKRLSERRVQTTLDGFLFRTAANQDPERFRSKRINKALRRIEKRDADLVDLHDVVNLSEDDDES